MYVWKKACKGGTPRTWVAVHTYAGPDPAEPKAGWESRKLVAGCAVRANLRAKGLVPVDTQKFLAPDVFWHWLERQAVPGRVTWIIGEDILRSLWLLDWPKLVTSCEWLLSDRAKPVGDASEEDQQGSQANPGLCLLEPTRTIIHGRFRGRRFNIVDLANYFPEGTLPPSPVPNTELGFQPRTMEPGPYCASWCKDRCLDTIGAIGTAIDHWQREDLGAWKYTLAALAANAYRRRFLQARIVCHGFDWASDIERAAYYDGRVQPFYRGDVLHVDKKLTGRGVGGSGVGRPSIHGPVAHVDMNSFYPSVMRDNDYPVAALCDSRGEPMVYTGLNPHTLADMLRQYCCVAHVKLKTDFDLYPFRVPREQQDKKGKFVPRSAASNVMVPDSTIYPVGEFDTVLCTPEVQMALTRGHVCEVYDVLLYERGRPFVAWVDYWTELRRKAKEAGHGEASEWYKAIACALTGKFGQRRRGWQNTARHEAPEPWVGWPHYDARTKCRKLLRAVGWQVQESVDYGTAKSSLVALSAHIASHARTTVRRALDMLGRREVLYVANDALLITWPGFSALQDAGMMHPTKPGFFGEPRWYDEARIWGVRDYEVDGKLVKSGLPAKRVDVGERRWLCRFAERGDALLSHPHDATVRYHWSIVLGDHGNEPGLWNDDGWHIAPRLGKSEPFKLATANVPSYTSSSDGRNVQPSTATLNPQWGSAKPRRGIRS